MRKLCIVFGFIVLLAGFFESVTFAGAVSGSSASFWSAGVTIADAKRVPTDQLVNRGNVDCEHIDLVSRQVSRYAIEDGQVIFGNNVIESVGRSYPSVCVSRQNQGLVASGFWAPDFDPTNVLSVDSGSYAMTQAPGGSAVLFSAPAPGYGTSYSINHSLSFIGSLDLKNPSSHGFSAEKIWRIDPDRLSDFLKYADGSVVRIDQIGFSLNGRYMAVQLSGRGFALVNLVTRRLTPFSSDLLSNGTGTFFAVSNDGKTVASYSSGNLVLHDLSGCGQAYDYGAWPKTGELIVEGCGSANHYGVIADRYPRLERVSRLRFSPSGASLFVDVGWREGEYVWQRLRLDALGYQKTARGYVALGDSFSSGEGDTQGASWYEPGTDEQGDPDSFVGRNLCHLSRRSYPYLLALNIGYLSSNLDSPPSSGLFRSLACSGAKMHNLTGGPLGERSVPGPAYEFAFADNQYLYGIDSPLGGLQPGAFAQIDAAERLNPDVVTLSIGGNDVGFGTKLAACLMPGVCELAISQQKRSAVAKEVAGQYGTLVRTYEQLRESLPEARIFVVGYPDFVHVGDTKCASNVHLEGPERDFVTRSTQYFNEVAAAAARTAGVGYVDVSDILAGGTLCSAGDNIKMVNGLTAGNDSSLSPVDSGLFRYGLCVFRNCIGSESFHPNQYAQPEYVARVLAVTSDLTAGNPSPAESFVPTPPDYFGDSAQAFVDEQNANGSGVPDLPRLTGMIVAARGYRAPVIGLDGLLPGSRVDIEVHSTPVALGSFVVSPNGQVDAEVILPSELEPGYHELHVSGYDAFGKRSHWYQPFLAGALHGDFDGDGSADDIDSCPAVYNIGTDADADGIDDGCDDDISLADGLDDDMVVPAEWAGSCRVTAAALDYLAAPEGADCRAARLDEAARPAQGSGQGQAIVVRRRSGGAPLDVVRVSPADGAIKTDN